ncbi:MULTISPECIES: hypothetical protein [unclassified Shewanella]|uniref:hypothetical protein n=1 Tax=unclassified Shewanella TaxID=196818 RepID=UPI000C856114|nr:MULTISPECIES: hypothetical protein [unclassified Shewanella]MDO6640542.1 hypothetical protein [Shewanella sp. 5_MG-2023]MDO6678807.1 hypothetical protein [Shewanella sp. 4_MG-2023]MDO6776219.1 hypothetical protein [Shewanella sp. 3_MG-2023]PMG28488.1 hypothetical protein BCU94_17550 [Shewanella sp. 10N.286.52.C2]PMG43294.1 hypothetical protein BCU91_05895 [Shewanella sp. 10N.286.52.B9]
MKKTLVAALLISLSAGVSAETLNEAAHHKLDSAMEQLITLDEQTDILITVDKNANFERVTYQGFVKDVYSEIYTTSHKAKQLGLEKVNKFYVYNESNIDKLSDKIAVKIDQDKPKAFSVDLYRNYRNDSGKFSYIARIIEYK